MPRDAKGVAIFEVTLFEDRQDIDIPEGVDVHWLVQPDPHTPSSAQDRLIRSFRGSLTNDKQLPRDDVYISEDWLDRR
jgi:hypothetical protein